MSVYVLSFPGSNCDRDALKAVQLLGYKASLLWHEENQIPEDAKLVIVPGGFSWGDYLRAGAISAQAPVITALRAYVQAGGFVLGICNGFQILCEAGFLPGALLRNVGQDFISRPCTLKVEDTNSPWVSHYQAGQVVNFPIAHQEGCYWVDQKGLKVLEAQGQVLLRYCDEEGQVLETANPNGSVHNIAAISNKEGTVVGMMPHPERNVETALSWGVLGGTGTPLFTGIMEASA